MRVDERLLEILAVVLFVAVLALFVAATVGRTDRLLDECSDAVTADRSACIPEETR